MKNYLQDSVKKLNAALELERKVVGVKFLFNKDEFENADARSVKGKMPYCVMIRKATLGYDMKVISENSGCIGGSNALGMKELENSLISGQDYKNIGLYRDITTCRSAIKNTSRFNFRIYGIEIKPLEQFNYDPDIVIIVSDSYQSMRIMQGYTCMFGADFSLRATGNQAVCSECTAYPYEHNHINISFLCSGTRYNNKWKDSEIMIGLPFNKFELLVEGTYMTLNATEPNEKKKEIEYRLKEEKIDFKVEYDNAYYMKKPPKKNKLV
ncbi:hypothetical protein DUF169 [Gottschalkia acidurici 9a]|uniref:DUF169 domain-containing protein n=1 Tax=Gottschalkia acidurici (strain ATCC 7906 / DSM 604 / BCRC 14475 / CIP 104303 / KCTC 5404 / NCIMB 10678 / 9a) TaxID=1128398 RepID=K0B0I0_GOTA9|nr:DUF169 domain-containing protein [Gottschalkia acidurici]AFS78156.1 hypothetical protein DUF169 [Gottschalkia acidurici 9a]